MKNSFITILDFGSSKITCMAASKVAGREDFLIRAVGQSSYNGFDENSWYEPDKLAEAVTDAISQVERKTETTVRELYVGVPGAFCATATGEASLTFHSKKKIDSDDVKELVEKAKIYDNVSDYLALEGKPVYFILDGVLKNYDPVGSVASKITALVSFSFIKTKIYFKTFSYSLIFTIFKF